MKNMTKQIRMIVLGLIIGISSKSIDANNLIQQTETAINKSNKKISKTFSDVGDITKALSPAKVSSDIKMISNIFGEIGDIINMTEYALQDFAEPISSLQEVIQFVKALQKLIRDINPSILLIEEQCYQLEANFN